MVKVMKNKSTGGSVKRRAEEISTKKPVSTKKPTATENGLRWNYQKKLGKTFAWGQYTPTSGRCIATSLTGKPCQDPLPLDKKGLSDHVPYCTWCRKNGDPSMFVTDHPKFGKILVANRKLPKGYRMAWWGDRTTKNKLPDPDWEWALDTHSGIINARPYQKGSLLQFAACPGPNERVTVWMGPRTDSNCYKKDLTSMIFSTSMEIPKKHQLCMMYNEDFASTDEFFAERGIKRADVGTTKYPCIKRKARA
jgi:hypothetical protein